MSANNQHPAAIMGHDILSRVEDVNNQGCVRRGGGICVTARVYDFGACTVRVTCGPLVQRSILNEWKNALKRDRQNEREVCGTFLPAHKIQPRTLKQHRISICKYYAHPFGNHRFSSVFPRVSPIFVLFLMIFIIRRNIGRFVSGIQTGRWFRNDGAHREVIT